MGNAKLFQHLCRYFLLTSYPVNRILPLMSRLVSGSSGSPHFLYAEGLRQCHDGIVIESSERIKTSSASSVQVMGVLHDQERLSQAPFQSVQQIL